MSCEEVYSRAIQCKRKGKKIKANTQTHKHRVETVTKTQNLILFHIPLQVNIHLHDRSLNNIFQSKNKQTKRCIFLWLVIITVVFNDENLIYHTENIDRTNANIFYLLQLDETCCINLSSVQMLASNQ